MSTKTFSQFVAETGTNLQATDFLVGYRPTIIDPTVGEIRTTIQDIASLVINQISFPPSLPPGVIMPFAGTMSSSTQISGWVLCDGSSYSKTDSLYINLFNAIKTTYGSSNSSTFKVPDLRGLFIRGFGGNGVHASAALGAIQKDTFLNHGHTVNDPGHGHTINDPQHTHSGTGGGYGNQLAVTGVAGWGVASSGNPLSINKSSTGITINASGTGLQVNNSTAGGSETRPVNLAMNYIIKL